MLTAKNFNYSCRPSGIIWPNKNLLKMFFFQILYLSFSIFSSKRHLIELDDGKIYRKPLYLTVKTMVSCRFSLKPIH